jgi:hypothetical protein
MSSSRKNRIPAEQQGPVSIVLGGGERVSHLESLLNQLTVLGLRLLNDQAGYGTEPLVGTGVVRWSSRATWSRPDGKKRESLSDHDGQLSATSAGTFCAGVVLISIRAFV